jgi:hypothetical protein
MICRFSLPAILAIALLTSASAHAQSSKPASKPASSKGVTLKYKKKYSGLYEPGALLSPSLKPVKDKPLQSTLVIRNKKDWRAFKSKIPTLVFSKKKPAPKNTDPILRARPRFKKSMVLVAIRGDTIFAKPKIKSVTLVDGVIVVQVIRDKAPIESRPSGSGCYAAVVIAKTSGKVKFVWIKGK